MSDSECIMAVILEKGRRPCQWSLIRRQFPPHPDLLPHVGRGGSGHQASGEAERRRAMAPAAVARTASF